MATIPLRAAHVFADPGRPDPAAFVDPYDYGDRLVFVGHLTIRKATLLSHQMGEGQIRPDTLEHGWIVFDRHRPGCTALMGEIELSDLDEDARAQALADEHAEFCDCEDDFVYPTGPDGLTWHFRPASATTPDAVPATFARLNQRLFHSDWFWPTDRAYAAATAPDARTGAARSTVRRFCGARPRTGDRGRTRTAG